MCVSNELRIFYFAIIDDIRDRFTTDFVLSTGFYDYNLIGRDWAMIFVLSFSQQIVYFRVRSLVCHPSH